MRVERESDREIMTTKRGKRIATSIEGTLTGLGGNLIIIDDPLKSGDAMSESVRSRVIEWYRSTLLSRPDDKTAARIVLVMQRVHQDDLAGYLREQGGFDVLSLPAIAQRDETHYLGDGRVKERLKGELLHPEHEPAKVLLELKREMGPIAFSAQYQQDPIPPGGTIIKRKWLTPYDTIGHQAGDVLIMSWDIALSETETGDYSACVVLLRRKEVFYVLEVMRGRFPFGTLKRKVMEVKERYGWATLLIEDSPISRGLIQSLREQSINVTTHKPETDKQARVIAQTDLFAGGSVRFPRKAAWLTGSKMPARLGARAVRTNRPSTNCSGGLRRCRRSHALPNDTSSDMRCPTSITVRELFAVACLRPSGPVRWPDLANVVEGRCGVM